MNIFLVWWLVEVKRACLNSSVECIHFQLGSLQSFLLRFRDSFQTIEVKTTFSIWHEISLLLQTVRFSMFWFRAAKSRSVNQGSTQSPVVFFKNWTFCWPFGSRHYTCAMRLHKVVCGEGEELFLKIWFVFLVLLYTTNFMNKLKFNYFSKIIKYYIDCTHFLLSTKSSHFTLRVKW